MHTQQLLCFILVADKLNFTKAAEELFLSTPTVTHHIKTLENELKTKLFVRNSKMVRLTESGAEFYEDAKEILEKIQIAEKKLKKIAGSDTALIKIGCTSNAEFNMLKSPLSLIHDNFPDITPRLYVNDYYSLKNSLENQQLDFLFSTRSIRNTDSNSSFFKLYDAANNVVLLRTSPLSSRAELRFEDLEGHKLITLHPKTIPFEYADRMRDSIIRHGFTHVDIYCENDQACIFLAECGFGAAILPDFCIPPLPPELIKIPFEKDSLFMEYGITYRSDLDNGVMKDILKIFKNIKHA